MTANGMSHTPGPWTIESAPHRAFVAQVGNGQLHIWTERQAKPGESYEWGSALADARLIAAAPELLNVLLQIVAPFDGAKAAGIEIDQTVIKAESQMLVRIREAIAKATGAA